MFRYIIGRLFGAVPVLLGVSIVVFSMLQLTPGDPVLLILGTANANIDKELVEQIRKDYGLDQPFYVQYMRWLGRAVQGDLGNSIYKKEPVTSLIMAQLPSTLQLTAAGLGISLVLGIVLGIVAAVKQNTWLDTGSMLVALMALAMPEFWLALLLIIVFSLQLGWLPAAGSVGLEALVLPALALGLRAAATIARLTRSSMLEVMRQDYIRTARAKGLREFTVITGHGFRNALIPVVTILGLQFGRLMSGTIIIETVFGRRGIGNMALTALLQKDFPLVQGTILMTATFYVLINLLVDISYAWIDPRIRYD